MLVSLFSDGRAPDDAILTDGSGDRRGWWADTYETSNTGSLLWLLARAKKAGNGAGYAGSQGNLLQQAKNTCQAALQWLIDDRVAATVSVATRWISATAMGIMIVITKPSGDRDTFDFAWAWTGVG